MKSSKNAKDASIAYGQSLEKNISSIKDMKNALNEDVVISDKIDPKISKNISLNIRNKKDCMKMKVADIKKSNEYKKIPRKYKKSKMKKDSLCTTIQDISQNDVDNIFN